MEYKKQELQELTERRDWILKQENKMDYLEEYKELHLKIEKILWERKQRRDY